MKSSFRLVLFVVCLFSLLVSANGTEEEIGDDSIKTLDYYNEDTDGVNGTRSSNEILPTNSTQEKDDYDYYGDTESINSTKEDVDHDFFTADFDNPFGMLHEVTEVSDPKSAVCGKGSSSFLVQIDNGAVDPLQITTEELLAYANDSEVLDCIHIVRNIAAFKNLISVLPDEQLGQIASRPGLLEKLPDDTIVALAEDDRVVAATGVGIITELVNTRPHTIGRLPIRTLDMFIRMPMFLDGLSSDTKAKLINNKQLVDKLSELPNSSLLSLVVNHWDILTSFPKDTDYPARALVAKLMMDREFLRQIPVTVHAKLAESNFRHQLNGDSVLLILSSHPELPGKLSDAGLRVNRHYMTNKTFVDGIPCAVFLNMVYDKKFMDKLEEKEMSVLSGSGHLWDCLPVELVRRVMRQYGGDHLGFENVISAVRTMRREKVLDAAVVANVIRYQVPRMVRKWWSRKRGGR